MSSQKISENEKSSLLKLIKESRTFLAEIQNEAESDRVTIDALEEYISILNEFRARYKYESPFANAQNFFIDEEN